MSEPIRVLMIEDDPLQLWLGVHILKGAGDIAVTTARDGLEGLEHAWSHRPHVILLDLILPGISGLELLRRYRAEGGKARVLVVTKAVGEAVSREALALGADFVLFKPVQWREVLDRIRFLSGGLARQYENLLERMGARPQSLGLRQAARCAALLGEGRCELLKQAYVEAAAPDRTTPGSVSKNIERLIHGLHTQNSLLYQQLMGPQATGAPPTNKDFLWALARAVRIPL